MTRDDIKKATLKAWQEMPESVILNSFGHLPRVAADIVRLWAATRSTSDHATLHHATLLHTAETETMPV